MATQTLSRTAEEVIAGWRDGEGEDSPAGPLFHDD